MTKFYVIKLLTNTEEQDASSIAVYQDEDPKAAEAKALVHYHQTLANYHNAPDVLYAVVEIQNELGNTTIKEIVDHRPEPEPEPTPEPETEE